MRVREDGTVFVITGDIPAMWLRDSAAQVRPLLALAEDFPPVVELVAGVLRLQVEQVLIDPYANAFRDRPPWVFERKYELDSLCAPLSLAWLLWRTTGSTAHIDGRFRRGRARDRRALAARAIPRARLIRLPPTIRPPDRLASGQGTGEASRPDRDDLVGVPPE